MDIVCCTCAQCVSYQMFAIFKRSFTVRNNCSDINLNFNWIRTTKYINYADTNPYFTIPSLWQPSTCIDLLQFTKSINKQNSGWYVSAVLTLIWPQVYRCTVYAGLRFTFDLLPLSTYVSYIRKSNSPYNSRTWFVMVDDVWNEPSVRLP